MSISYSCRARKYLPAKWFRRFVGLPLDGAARDHWSFSANREHLLNGPITPSFFDRVQTLAERQQSLFGDHFSINGTSIEAWVSMTGFKKRMARVHHTPMGDVTPRSTA